MLLSRATAMRRLRISVRNFLILKFFIYFRRVVDSLHWKARSQVFLI